ncbi:MAG: alpha-1,2-fucosyltransferase [Bacteroidales bacterium]|nr:alpha-1,2-fucosyltransferase [Bacteroidales bacterium]MDD4712275.1 alpha-1,2-fucosyltransferase [Bacteroidales bacterium]
MIYVLLNGRLGNNLFQIAAGASLAAEHNTNFYVYTGEYQTPYPENFTLADYLKQFEKNILRNIIIIHEKPTYTFLYQEKNFSYEKIEYVDNMMIDGFFQSEKYFNPDIIRKLFAIDAETKFYIEKKYNNIFQNEITSINIRRGDYLFSVDNHPICTIKYFKKAIKLIGENKKFLVISDDIDWCKKKFQGENFIFPDKEPPIIDFYLQTFCTNNIISNSTFSWWASWLNPNPDKIVICPDPWFGVALQNKSTKDLLPENWIKIKNKMPIHLSVYGYYLWWKKRIEYYIRTKINTHNKDLII